MTTDTRGSATIPPFAPNGMCPKHSLYPRECIVCEVLRRREGGEDV